MTTMQEYYGFERAPFSKDLSYKELYRYPQLEQLFERLRVTTADGAGLLVTGRAGTGKTTAVRGFLDSLEAKYRVIYLGQYQKGTALFAKLGLEFGIRKHLIGARRMVSLVQRVTDESNSGRKIVLVIDEAHLLERPTFEDIRLLTNADMDRRSPMSLIMLGQRWLRGMLKSDIQEALYQRLRLRYALEGLSEGETKEYIQHHLELAGNGKVIFTNEAIKIIFVASEGILREINNICYEALLVGFSKKAKKIDPAIVNWVVDQRELS
jgi:type II secretory pathway predicted ATPase ExeA